MLQATNYKTKGRLSKPVSLISPHLPGVTHLCGPWGGKIWTLINNDDNKYTRVINLFAIMKSGWLVCHGGLRSGIKAGGNDHLHCAILELPLHLFAKINAIRTQSDDQSSMQQ